MVRKYAALARLARLPEGKRKLALRAAATRWPGSLREGELIGPTEVAAREAAAQAGLSEPERARASWIDEPAQAVLCWASLHLLIHDQRRFRVAEPTLASDSQAFSRWIVERDPDLRWPEPARITAIVGPKLRVRSAYLWLAVRAGFDLPSLNALLLARAGHWDRRADDPAWAHD